MVQRQIFDLLDFPITPARGGDAIVFCDKRTVRSVGLRGTEFAIRDVAVNQGKQPWLICERELFLLADDGQHELAFDIAPFGTPIGARDFYSTVLEAEATAGSAARVFLVNMRAGAWAFELNGHEMRSLNTAPLPFLAICSWVRERRSVIGGMTLRRQSTDSTGGHIEISPGGPAVLHWGPAPSAQASATMFSIERLRVPEQWREVPRRQGISARAASQLLPEACIAATEGDQPPVLLFGLLALSTWDDPMDELAVRPMNFEYLGAVLASSDGETLVACNIFRSVLGTLHTNGMTWAYATDNRGNGGAVSSLVRIEFDSSGVRSEKPVTFAGVSGSLICSSFQPRVHPSIGYFGTAAMFENNHKSLAHYLQSDDGLNWHVVGRAGEVAPLNQ
jgi:hypothetical protein